jgi:hypothetical protein
MIQDALKCPSCGAQIDARTMHVGRPFECAACSRYLLITLSYGGLVFCASIAAAAMLALIVGLRGWMLCFATALGWIPLYPIIRFVSNEFAPPKVSVSPVGPMLKDSPLSLSQNWRR